jgi:hypothetical protein
MKNADQAGCRRPFRESGRCWNSWDKVAGWILLLAFVLGGTQVLLAQHGPGHGDSTTRAEKLQGVAQGHEPITSTDERKHWSAEPGCFEQKRDIPDRTVSRSWTLLSPDGRYKAYAVNEAIAERSNGEISGCKSTTKLFVSGPGSEGAKAVLTIEPAQYVNGNSVELVDWSPHGHLLLFTEGNVGVGFGWGRRGGAHL